MSSYQQQAEHHAYSQYVPRATTATCMLQSEIVQRSVQKEEIDLTLASSYIPALSCLARSTVLIMVMSRDWAFHSLPLLMLLCLVLYVERIVRRETILDSSALVCTLLAAHIINICRSGLLASTLLPVEIGQPPLPMEGQTSLSRAIASAPIFVSRCVLSPRIFNLPTLAYFLIMFLAQGLAIGSSGCSSQQLNRTGQEAAASCGCGGRTRQEAH